MLRIGDFSKIAKVSVRMLRYYDQIGLLKPAYIDTNSGYRNYSVDQLSRLNRIIFLKDIGFSLNEVMELVDETISIEEMKGMLLKRKQQLEHEISMAQINLSTVMDRLSSIEKEREIQV
jgi:DNA-binding transcriptional MerR regulator